MKKVVFILMIFSFVFGICFFSPLNVDAVSKDCIVDKNGKKKCKYSKQTNDDDFRYNVSQLKVDGNYLIVSGWAFLKGADSYSSSKYKYKMHVRSGGKNIYSVDATAKIADVTCLHFLKRGNFATILDDTCWKRSDEGTITSLIHNNNSSADSSNNVYRYVGFVAKININTLKSKLVGGNGSLCKTPSDINCKETETSPGKSFSLRLQITVPKDATRESDKNFYRDLIIYKDAFTTTEKNKLKAKGITITTSDETDKFTTREDYGYLRTSNLSKGSIKQCGKACKKDAGNYSFATGNNIYIPGYNYYNKTNRTFKRATDTNFKEYSYGSGTGKYKIRIDALKLNGRVRQGYRNAKRDGKSYILFPSGEGYKTSGYISETWTLPENGSKEMTTFTVTVTENCTCTTRVNCSTADTRPWNCDSNQKGSLIDSMSIGNNVAINDTTKFNILINGGSKYDQASLNFCRSKFNYSTNTSCPVYCLQNSSFSFYDRKDIYGADFYDNPLSYIEAGRYFRILPKTKANVSYTCQTKSGCATALTAVMNNLKNNFKYNFNYDWGEDNNNHPGVTIRTNKTETSSTNNGQSATYAATYTFKNIRQYYLEDNVATSNKNSFPIRKKNIYPVSLNAKSSKEYNTTLSYYVNNKYTNKTYFCPYKLYYDPDPDPEDPDIPGEEIPEEETKVKYYYRTISLTNVFPNQRTAGINWADHTDYINQIETLGMNLYNRVPFYSFDLDSTNMRNIKSYNDTKEKNGKGYLDLPTCELDEKTNKFVCTSTFLKEARSKNYVSSYTKEGVEQ